MEHAVRNADVEISHFRSQVSHSAGHGLQSEKDKVQRGYCPKILLAISEDADKMSAESLVVLGCLVRKLPKSGERRAQRYTEA